MFEITSEDVKAALDRAKDKAQRFYGGVWKLVAKRSIVAYLEGRLKDLVDAGRVVIMM